MDKPYNRNAAIQISVVDPDTGKAPEGQMRFIKADGGLFAVFNDGIYQLFAPETIDPDNKNPDTRPAYQKVHRIGASNSYVARSILQATEMLSRVPLRPGLTKEQITDQIWVCTRHLLKCEAAHFEIYNQVLEKRAACDEVVEQNKKGGHIPSLPQVDDLETKVQTFFNHAKKLLIETYRLISLFFDAPDFEAGFSSMVKWLAENKPESVELIRMLGTDLDWNNFLVYCRNAMEHAKPHYRVEVANFKLHPGNRFSDPSWRYDLTAKQGPKQENFTDIVLDFDTHIQNLLTFLEQVFMLCLMDNVAPMAPGIKCRIYRIPDEKIDRSCPIGYQAELELSGATKVSGDG